MIIFSILAYVAIVAWYLLGNRKSQPTSSIIGTCFSSFFAYWYWGENYVATIIYLVMGIICIFFHWISIDANKTASTTIHKSKTVAAMLALLLGGLGIHRFYLRKTTSGLFYVLFFWSIIPGIIGIIESIRLFSMNQERFDKTYNMAITQQSTNVQNDLDSQEHSRVNTEPTNEVYNEYYSQIGVNERNGDELNYRDIRVCGYRAEAIGTVEDFSIVVKSKSGTYTFKAKDGDICSYRSSAMRGTKPYEVI